MAGIPQFILTGPFWGIVAFLTVVVALRSQATYWLGRLATAGVLRGTASSTGWRGKLHQWLASASVRSGTTAIEKWGLIIIPASFLTWGFQTLIHAGAGVLRINWPVYTLVACPGYVVWALIYSTAGISVWKAVLAALAGNIYAFIGLTLLVVVPACWFVWRRIRQACSPRATVQPQA